MNKEYKIKEEYKGTYLEELINTYNNFINKPKFYGKEAYEYLKSLKIEIAETRKQMKREGKIKG